MKTLDREEDARGGPIDPNIDSIDASTGIGSIHCFCLLSLVCSPVTVLTRTMNNV